MFSQLEFLIAFRYLRSKIRRIYINYSWIFGWNNFRCCNSYNCNVVANASVQNIRRILGLNGHIGIYENQNNFLNYDEFSVGVGEIPGVKAVTPQIEGQGLIVYNNNSSGIVVRGVRWSDLSARKQLWNSIGNKEINPLKVTG